MSFVIVELAKDLHIRGSSSNTYLDILKVRNYDGSWTEWGNMIGNPVEK